LIVTPPVALILAPVFLVAGQPPVSHVRAGDLHTLLWFLGVIGAALIYLSGNERQWRPVARLVVLVLGIAASAFGMWRAVSA
jgi:hypothetical protein